VVKSYVGLGMNDVTIVGGKLVPGFQYNTQIFGKTVERVVGRDDVEDLRNLC